MRINTIEFLRCPFCASSIELKPGAVEDEPGVSFGITVCIECAYEFPIVGGVLIIAELAAASASSFWRTAST
jgi:hypothetical protein